jgi:HEPN domain-containing protein
MREPDPRIQALTERWIAKAETDYRTARRLAEDAEGLLEPIAFHCQQAAEKYLKAFLVSRGADFPKTHDIRQLLYLVEPFAMELAAALRDLDALTPYGVEIRYPDDLPSLLPGRERDLVALATRAREAVRAELVEFLREE